MPKTRQMKDMAVHAKSFLLHIVRHTGHHFQTAQVAIEERLEKWNKSPDLTDYCVFDRAVCEATSITL